VITAQLVEATTGFHRWAERYDRSPGHLGVQEEIARKDCDRTGRALDGRERPAWGASTRQPEAYDYYLRGLDYVNRLTPEANAQRGRCLSALSAWTQRFAAAYGGPEWELLDGWTWRWCGPRTRSRRLELPNGLQPR